MKKSIIIAALCCFGALNMQAQEIYNEVKRIMAASETTATNKSLSIEERKIATFKADAIYYLISKAAEQADFSEQQLGLQTDAMIDFVNLYVKRLADTKKKADRATIMAKFKNATTHNSLFNDTDREVTYAYVDNDKYITQFSIDTDWVKALAEVRK